MAIKNTIPSKLLSIPNDLELLTVSITFTETYTVCLIYNPPNSTDEYQQSLLNYLQSLNSLSNIIIIGDLNLPDANWDAYTGESSFTQYFCEKAFNLNLMQLVNKPTHRRGNILDIILTNQSNITDITIHSVLPHSLRSDHYVITFNVLLESPTRLLRIMTLTLYMLMIKPTGML